MVYGVFDGEYSDWGIVGYFTKLEDAEKYCAVHTDCYYYKMPSLKDKEDLSKVELCFEHEIVFDKTDKCTYRMRNEPDRYIYYQGSELRENTVEYGKGLATWICFKINTKMRGDRKRCEKIAQDWLAKIRAEKIELGKELM